MNSPSYITVAHEMAHKFDQNIGIRIFPGLERHQTNEELMNIMPCIMRMFCDRQMAYLYAQLSKKLME